MKLMLLPLIFSCCIQLVHATINPEFKECMQRAYTVDGDYCVFPDSTRCLLTAFNKKECGVQWFTEDYCIEEGQYVWDADKCCEGLFAYLPANVAGQASCQKKTLGLIAASLGGKFWIFALIIAILFGLLFFLRTRSRQRKA